ncbi:AraC family transcriptional regulator [Staphylococcus canis]|uniref:Helix-turn-helix transcriptional regulator n=1 Tax=Staphylococcus canis TaxID=2724942 RepID=A0ABS0T6E6_9STAP|nr:helix-turn-helix domain-containing protein [Staphylococcus canis]MBI5974320.1 helix-turn-helix transcriptional regulator [Staphylococcus canis]
MQGVTIELIKHYQTEAHRIFNEVTLMISLEDVLDVQCNGKKIKFYNQVALFTHNDIVKVFNAQSLIIVHIPLHFFSKYQSDYLLGYFNHERLSSHNRIKTLIQSIIKEESYEQQNIFLEDVLSILFKETYMSTERVHIPEIQTQNALFSNVTEYINQHRYEHIALKSIADHFFVSQSYISILFNKYINMNFKTFIVSLQINLSLNKLLSTNETIQNISLEYGFTNYTNYSKQFKNLIGQSPIEYRKSLHSAIPALHISPYDRQHFDAYFVDHISQKDYQSHSTIHLQTLNPTTYINQKYLFLETPQSQSIMDTINEISHISDFKDEYYLYFNKLSVSQLEFFNSKQIEWLCHYIQHQKLNLAFKIDSVQNLKKLESHFLEPLLKVLATHCVSISETLLTLNIVLDIDYLSLHDIHYIRHQLDQLIPKYQFTLIVNLPYSLRKNHMIQQLFDHHMSFDFYMLGFKDLDWSLLRNEDENKEGIDLVKMMIKNLTQLIPHSNYRIILTNINESLFELLFDHHISEHPELFLYFLTIFNSYINGLSLSLMPSEQKEISLYNQYFHKSAIQLIYELFHRFENQHVTLTDQYLVSENNHAYQILLFDPLFHFVENHKDSKGTTHYQIIKSEHLSKNIVATYQFQNQQSNVEYMFPSEIQRYYIPSHLIKEIDQNNQLQIQTNIHDFRDTTLEIQLAHRELKQLIIYKTKATLRNNLY